MVQEWVKTSELAERWSFDRTTIWRRRHEMQAIPQFADGVRGVRRGLRINVEIFDEYMRWRDRQRGARG